MVVIFHLLKPPGREAVPSLSSKWHLPVAVPFLPPDACSGCHSCSAEAAIFRRYTGHLKLFSQWSYCFQTVFYLGVLSHRVPGIRPRDTCFVQELKYLVKLGICTRYHRHLSLCIFKHHLSYFLFEILALFVVFILPSQGP